MRGRIWKRQARLAALLLAGASLAACATVQPKTGAPGSGAYKVGKPYQVRGVWYTPAEDPTYDRTGIASWYGDAFHMKATANGERFDMNAVTAAHTTLPLPSMVEVTNLENGRRTMVRVNDRGPFVDNRIIDLSRAAAQELGFDRAGLAKVRVRYVGPAPLNADGSLRLARVAPQSVPAPAAPPAAPYRTQQPILAQNTYAAPPAVQQAPATPFAVTPVTVRPVAPRYAASQIDAPVAAPLPPPTSPSPVTFAQAPAQPVVQPLAPTGAAYRVQVGAFSDPLNARRVVSQLAETGEAVIESITRNGTTLYRVVMDAPGEEGQALILRDSVARFGFPDARVIRAAGL